MTRTWCGCPLRSSVSNKLTPLITSAEDTRECIMTKTDENGGLELWETRFNLPFTILNLGSTAGAIVLPFFYHSMSSVVAFLVMYTICGLGLTAGYHRLFAHRAYAVPKWLERVIAVCGFLAIQRGPLFWVAMHRLHNLTADVPSWAPH